MRHQLTLIRARSIRRGINVPRGFVEVSTQDFENISMIRAACATVTQDPVDVTLHLRGMDVLVHVGTGTTRMQLGRCACALRCCSCGVLACGDSLPRQVLIARYGSAIHDEAMKRQSSLALDAPDPALVLQGVAGVPSINSGTRRTLPANGEATAPKLVRRPAV